MEEISPFWRSGLYFLHIYKEKMTERCKDTMDFLKSVASGRNGCNIILRKGRALAIQWYKTPGKKLLTEAGLCSLEPWAEANAARLLQYVTVMIQTVSRPWLVLWLALAELDKCLQMAVKPVKSSCWSSEISDVLFLIHVPLSWFSGCALHHLWCLLSFLSFVVTSVLPMISIYPLLLQHNTLSSSFGCCGFVCTNKQETWQCGQKWEWNGNYMFCMYPIHTTP